MLQKGHQLPREYLVYNKSSGDECVPIAQLPDPDMTNR